VTPYYVPVAEGQNLKVLRFLNWIAAPACAGRFATTGLRPALRAVTGLSCS
jgi:hypothetical protein